MAYKARFPGYRTMTGAERRNARASEIWEGAKQLERKKHDKHDDCASCGQVIDYCGTSFGWRDRGGNLWCGWNGDSHAPKTA